MKTKAWSVDGKSVIELDSSEYNQNSFVSIPMREIEDDGFITIVPQLERGVVPSLDRLAPPRGFSQFDREGFPS